MSKSLAALPLPPDELIDRVVSGFSNDDAEGARALFLKSGQRSLEDLVQALAAVGHEIGEHQRILEFGCGCGRIMRWMRDFASTSTLIGTDIDERAIAWASDNLPFATFHVNAGLPPTHYRDSEFDLIINHSVFTHLDESYQDSWLAELHRITAPDSLLVLSTHGEHAFAIAEQQLAADSPQKRQWRSILERDGILHTREDAYTGSSFPDFYHTTFHAPRYIFEHWSRWFDVLAVLPRSSLNFQDQIVLRHPAVRAPGTWVPLGTRAPAANPKSTADAALATLDPNAIPEALEGPLETPDLPSRFGRLGLIARRLLFRVARPLLHAQFHVDSSLSDRLARVEARLDERLSPVVHEALRRQAERIDRLDREVQHSRRANADDRSTQGTDAAPQ
jgi:SAM-dependent methyltransferase